MKLKNRALAFSLIIGISIFFNIDAKALSIKGNFKNIGTSKWAFIYQYLGNEILKVDSAKITENQFQYQGKLPRGLYRIGISEEKSFNLILADENLEISADFENLASTINIQGSKENELYSKLNGYNIQFNEEFTKLDQQAQPILAVRNSDPQKFNTEIKKLQSKLDSITKERNRNLKKFSEDNKGLYVSKLTTPYISDEATKKESFFTNADLNETDIARSDALPAKIIAYLQKYAGQQMTQLQEEAAYLLGLPTAGSLNKEVFYISLIKIFAPYDIEYAKALTNMYVTEFPKSAVAMKVKSSLPKGAPQVGDVAPEIKLSDPSGKQISLSSLKGKIVLLDFWASWCGPCRHENPNVVKAYQKYKDKGFTVFSVSLDENKDKWTQAIAKDGLVWTNHVSDLKGWQSSAAQLYHVKGIPATFLIGKDGIVVGANLRGASLEKKLEQLCK